MLEKTGTVYPCTQDYSRNLRTEGAGVPTIFISHWLKAALVEMDVKVGSSDQKKDPRQRGAGV